jgi:ubiquinone/menaquinone biosynthesis C-methylase UbiE
MTSMGDEFSLRDIEFHRETAASYDAEVTETYGVYHRLLLEPYLDEVAADLAPGPALDLGSGTGVVSLALARRGFDVVGVDHSPEMTEVARQKLRDADVRGSCRFVIGDVRQLPFGDGEFACVTCQGLLHHLDDLEPCLRELARVLRPGGRFYISEPCSDETPLKRGLRGAWQLRHAKPRATEAERPESVEAPIAAADLRSSLLACGLEHDVRFLTHLGPLRRMLPEQHYVLAVRAASWPWRTRRGDLVFVFGWKPWRAS